MKAVAKPMNSVTSGMNALMMVAAFTAVARYASFVWP